MTFESKMNYLMEELYLEKSKSKLLQEQVDRLEREVQRRQIASAEHIKEHEAMANEIRAVVKKALDLENLCIGKCNGELEKGSPRGSRCVLAKMERAWKTRDDEIIADMKTHIEELKVDKERYWSILESQL
ncbi:hypothetical protein H0H81_004784 [Sphagnurus paluster]|uniref:Uncharacterized protein n=1 Tax=Sphagnurus paluster TaxID=117069 RepID=A0A9P7GT72_9AGAR|nr:hypothetical protein H0H81_004784 [Sphagnurus paluster]